MTDKCHHHSRTQNFIEHRTQHDKPRLELQRGSTKQTLFLPGTTLLPTIFQTKLKNRTVNIFVTHLNPIYYFKLLNKKII